MDKTEYCVEFRRDDVLHYRKSFDGFADLEMAIEVAKNAAEKGLNARVVEQRRRVLNVFSCKKGRA